MENKFEKKADLLKPELNYKDVPAVEVISVERREDDYDKHILGGINYLQEHPMKRGDKVCLDFGKHCVGYLNFRVLTVGNPPDNPAHIKLKFGETLCEIVEPFEEYKGNISSSWLQEEYMFIDIFPATIEMPRRYAFRYVEFEVLDTSWQYSIVLQDIVCSSVSSADRSKISAIKCKDERLCKIDEIAINTLEGCMQDVFEDGPKRDRRLWIGDFRLQALTNYETFHDLKLVKRCLYLFAAVPLESGKIGACLYVKPKVIVDTAIHLFDYSLFFVFCLFDYYQASQDYETVNELWNIAYNQILLAEKELDKNALIKDQPENWWWCFVDWNEALNKQASAQAIYIVAIRKMKLLAEKFQKTKEMLYLEQLLEKCTEAALKFLWNSEQQVFVSGEEQQVSWASQIWFAIAGVFSKEQNRKLLEHIEEINPRIRMNTPYMNHCYVEALVEAGMMEKAKEHIKWYWGGMVDAGADCFWEVYNPDSPKLSAYGNSVINSYCHAWSCTPSYFIRKYFQE